ncbi:MAG TPA: YdiU family protein, partial [Polyangiaceae bacterium]
MPFSSSYRPRRAIVELGEAFYDRVRAATFPKHELRFRNRVHDAHIGLADLSDDEWRAHFGRFEPLPDNLEYPLALRYHGHQFDVYNPQLGDGRGFLFAQLEDEKGRLLDLGTKGSGRTPWSRGGDGKLTLKGGVREVLATEMLEALGVTTSKSLSLIETGEELLRGDEPSPTRSSVLVRLSHSHVRIGTFQRLAFLKETANLEKLLEYSIRHYFPEIVTTDPTEKVTRFLQRVAKNVARLASETMVAGFVHGVLNSDNMTITGESFDYGPYRFLPTYDVDFVAAYFDQAGLYDYGSQPRAMFRNLLRLAESLRPLAPDLVLANVFASFENDLENAMTERVLRRLGVVSRGEGEDVDLVSHLYAFLESSNVGYEQFFFDVHGGKARLDRALASSPAKA